MPCVYAGSQISKWPEASQVELTVAFREIYWFFCRALHSSFKCLSLMNWLHFADILPCFWWFVWDSSSIRGQLPCNWQYLQLTFQFKQILVRWRILWLCRPINLPPTIFFWRLARWARTSWTEIRTWQEAQPPRTTNSREEQVFSRDWYHSTQY